MRHEGKLLSVADGSLKLQHSINSTGTDSYGPYQRTEWQWGAREEENNSVLAHGRGNVWVRAAAGLTCRETPPRSS